MPAGVDWFPYLRVAFASFLSAAAGAQMVHMYYKPDLSIPETPPQRGELPQLRKMQQLQQQKQQSEQSQQLQQEKQQSEPQQLESTNTTKAEKS